jgi:large subunit ribosomal protein L15
MKLHTLTNTPGAKTRRRRVGCGIGSGHGKTSGRGNKGMKARSGGGVRPGYEGGQMPLYRKLPHRGFNNYKFRTEYTLINIGDFSLVKADKIDAAALIEAGLIRKDSLPLKVLGSGKLDRAVTVTAHKFSVSARESIKKAGGQVVELTPPAAPAAAAPVETPKKK